MRRPRSAVHTTLAAFLGGGAAALVPAATVVPGHGVTSPDGRIEVRLRADDRLRYDVLLRGKPLLQDSTLSLNVDGATLGHAPRIRSARTRAVDRTIEPPVRQKAARLRERYNELRLELQRGYALVVRAFDEGVAYRFETTLPGPDVKVFGEEVALNFAGDWPVYFHREEGYFSHNERHYVRQLLKDLGPDALATTPAVVDADGVKIAIADSDIEDYPGLWLGGTGRSALAGRFAPYPLEEKLERDRDFKVVRAAEYIAVTKGTRTYPWRVLGIAEKDADLLTSSLVYLLAKPSALADTSWIRPGKVAWDWYNANNLYAVDFESGVNTATYKHYIDFASAHRIEYVILVMQRDDQKVIEFYHRVCREAAKRRMLVDFHGAIRPAHMTRTWPNLLTTEGVLGLEQFKWSAKSDPEHNLTLPFTRMFVGPFDYTPGAMRNASRKSFAPIFHQPMSLGTRCQQLAMYVVFESPLQMLADTPSSYLREPEIMEFLGPVPVVWDETKVIEARMGDYVVVARRSGSHWYLGAMTDFTPRELEVPLDFLPAGSFRVDSYEDGVNAGRWASDYRRVKRAATRATRLKLRLTEGGGFAARITPAP